MYTKGKWEIYSKTLLKNDSEPEQYISCTGSDAEANAKRICYCVNNFDNLLEACKKVKGFLTNGFEPDKALCVIERAIAKAKGE